jgi:hypothetical protein
MLSAVGGSKRLNRLNSSMHGDGDCDVGEVMVKVKMVHSKRRNTHASIAPWNLDVDEG